MHAQILGFSTALPIASWTAGRLAEGLYQTFGRSMAEFRLHRKHVERFLAGGQYVCIGEFHGLLAGLMALPAHGNVPEIR